MHFSVLQKEVMELMSPKPNENFIDATFGEGGHGLKILEKIAPHGKLLAIENDPEIYARNKIENERLILINDSYANIEKIVKENSFSSVNGILFDLGVCAWHLKESGRGFSFQRDEPLDMRFNPNTNNLTAFEIVNYWNEEKIAEIINNFGQEKFYKAISKKIIEQRKIRPIRTTLDLVEVIKKSIPLRYQEQKIHFATRTFQALRVAVNQELSNLKKGLKCALNVLEKEGRIAVISFHSLEDRIVKNFFTENKKLNKLKVVTKKPIRPTEEEIKINFSSRSAKLRVAQKV